MKEYNSKPYKEMVDPSELTDIVNKSKYPKPDWMLNASVTDKIWLVAPVGYDLSVSTKNKKLTKKLSFKRKISEEGYLTDSVNSSLLLDIRNSLLYLWTIGKLSRSDRAATILKSISELLLHTNELRDVQKKQPIRSLAEIKFEDIKSYILAFGVERRLFEQSLNYILSQWNNKAAIDWEVLRSKYALTNRLFKSLKHKLTVYLNINKPKFGAVKSFKRKFRNANQVEFDIEFDLAPKEKTISNAISSLQAFYTSSPSQIYKFRHSIMAELSGGRAIFDEMVEPIKTPLIPLEVSMHVLSSALHFVRSYGESIRHYLSELHATETNRINSLNLAKTTLRRYATDIKTYAFDNTQIPEQLENLNITGWGGHSANNNLENIENGITLCTLVKLYMAAIWICLSSFTASRKASSITLKRNCFRQSPIDGLFDIVMRIPKSSERYQLEDVYRPIPDLIYDYGVEFALLSCELESRRELVAHEDELFLFARILSPDNMAAFRFNKLESFGLPISDDTILASVHLFQDWSKTPLMGGKRWYFTTHQLRRLFAVLYFNFSDELGLDELSWFMGHSNLEQTFHYAELDPSDEWLKEAEATIARIGAAINKTINGDELITGIVEKARGVTNVSTILEPLVLKMIDEHKRKTGQQVRFTKIDDEDVFFYFTTTGE